MKGFQLGFSMLSLYGELLFAELAGMRGHRQTDNDARYAATEY